MNESSLFTVGYTMSDIHYKWNDGLNSVQIAADVSLPQFKVMGHRQKTIEASLSTGLLVYQQVSSQTLKFQCHSNKSFYFILHFAISHFDLILMALTSKVISNEKGKKHQKFRILIINFTFRVPSFAKFRSLMH